MTELKTKWHGLVEFIEKEAGNMIEEALAVGKAKEYELVIVGKGQQHLASTMVANLKDSQLEHAELGPIGNLLSSVGQGISSSVLVIQDHDLANSKIAIDKRTVITDAVTGTESSV